MTQTKQFIIVTGLALALYTIGVIYAASVVFTQPEPEVNIDAIASHCGTDAACVDAWLNEHN